MLLIGLILLIITCVLYLNDCRRPRKFPPGPRWLPFVGSFLTLWRLKNHCGYLHLALEQLSNTYGPVMGLKLGQQKFVVLSGSQLIKSALTKQQFNGRPDGFFFRARAFGKRRGLLFTDGPSWSQTKRLTAKYLSTLGFGHETMDNYLKHEAAMLVAHFRGAINKNPVAMHQAFDVAVLNTLWTIVAGYRFSYDDSRLHRVLSIVHKAFRSSDTLGGILSLLPFLRYIAPELSGYRNLMTILHELWGFIESEIDTHLETFHPEMPPRSLIDAFLVEMASPNVPCDREDLVVLCLDLFMAGLKTTADSLTAIFALLLHHLDWMDALASDLDRVVGPGKAPGLEHMFQLPRVEAFIAEAHRVLVLTPLGVPHRAVEDVCLRGFLIPKDTVVIFNFHSVNVDESCWDMPKEFRPERFLDKNGLFRRKNDLIMFGLGKRRCIGEILARQTLFLFFTHIIHNFHLQVPAGQSLPRLDGIDGFTVSPRPYRVFLTPREEH